MPEIKNIVDKHHPHVLGLSEANLLKHHDQSLVQIADYDLHLPLTFSNPLLQTSRIVTYTHKSVVVKLRTDLMSDSFSSIWIELGLPRKKKFLVCQIYREWQLLNPTLGNSSTDEGDHLIRWLEFLDQLERALDSGLEVHVMGDFNIDQCNWTLPNTRLKSLIHALFMQILPRGVSQLVIGPTRHCPYQSSSGLDHFYTNSPSRISCVEKIVCGGSDHMLISVKRSTKMKISSPAYIRKRSSRNFNSHDFVAAIRQISWLDIYLYSSIDDAVKLLSEKITWPHRKLYRFVRNTISGCLKLIKI